MPQSQEPDFEFVLEPLQNHYLKNFDCGKKSLNDWLKDNAKRSQNKGAARVYILSKGNEVVGFYTLSNGAVTKSNYPQEDQAGLPPIVPGLLIGRAGIHKDYQRKGIGTMLSIDAFEKILQVSQLSGVVAAYLHVDEQSALSFWMSLGFKASTDNPTIPDDNLTVPSEQKVSVELYMPIATLETALRAHHLAASQG